MKARALEVKAAEQGAPAKIRSVPRARSDLRSRVTLRFNRVTAVPPVDAFNQNNGTFGIVEGPVWMGDALYISEIGPGSNPPLSRILKVTADEQVTVVRPDAGTNGLAIDAQGLLYGASHKIGGLIRIDLGAPDQVLVDRYNGARLDSPNDLAIRSDGTFYFTDPSYQAPAPLPQTATRLYRWSAGAGINALAGLPQPNGVTLSLDESKLYVATQTTVYRYPVNSDGSLGSAATFVSGGSDGMGLDCAGNLYVTRGTQVIVFSPAGTELGRIDFPDVQSVTNVAFGGAAPYAALRHRARQRDEEGALSGRAHRARSAVLRNSRKIGVRAAADLVQEVAHARVRAAVADAAQVLLPKHAERSAELGRRLGLTLDAAHGRAVLEELRSEQRRHAAPRAALRGDVDLAGSLSIQRTLPTPVRPPAPAPQLVPREQRAPRTRARRASRSSRAHCRTLWRSSRATRCSRVIHRALTLGATSRTKTGDFSALGDRTMKSNFIVQLSFDFLDQFSERRAALRPLSISERCSMRVLDNSVD